MTRNHLSGGEASGDQRGSSGTRAATVSHEFREGQKSPTPQELEEAKILDLIEEAISLVDIRVTFDSIGRRYTHVSNAREVAEAILRITGAENEKLRASLLEAVGPFVRAFRTLDARFDGETKVMIELPTTKRVRPMAYVYVEDVLRLREVHTRLSSSLEGGEG